MPFIVYLSVCDLRRGITDPLAVSSHIEFSAPRARGVRGVSHIGRFWGSSPLLHDWISEFRTPLPPQQELKGTEMARMKWAALLSKTKLK